MKFSRFRRILALLGILALLPIVFGSALSVHSKLLVGGLQANIANAEGNPEYANTLLELSGDLDLYSTLGLITAATGVLLLLIILLSMHRGRLGIYRSYLRKLVSADAGTPTSGERAIFSLSTLAFPNEDDLGNLGATLNAIIARLREFEALRHEELLLADSLTRAAVNECAEPVAVFDDRFVLLFFSPAFAESMKTKITAGMHTNEIFTDMTSLEQLTWALGRVGEAKLEPRLGADMLIPITITTLSRETTRREDAERPQRIKRTSVQSEHPGFDSKRLMVRFAPPIGPYSDSL
jgi:hypothetical protein